MSRWVPQYECDRCGACCIHLGVPVDNDDMRREPLVAAAASYLMNLEVLPEGGPVYLACGSDYPCALLGNDGSCSVYATRPEACERFPPGEWLCQWSRGRSGLGALVPVNYKERK